MRDDVPPLLTVRQAAALLFPTLHDGQGPRRVYRWVRDGPIPPEAIVRVGKAVYLRRAVLIAWLEGGQAKGGADRA